MKQTAIAIYIFNLLFHFFAATAVAGQKSGNIRGQAYDDLFGLTFGPTEVQLLFGDKVIQTTRTDRVGKFHFTNVPAGHYTIKIHCTAGEECKTEVEVKSGESLDVD